MASIIYFESEKRVMEHLCFKGTEKRTAEEIAEVLESKGGDLNAFTHEEITAYHVRLPSKHLELAIDVISDIFFNPTFPEEEFHRESEVICEEIKMYKDNPRAHSMEMLKNNLYEQPWGGFIAGSQETVKSMTQEQLLAKHRSTYVPKNSVLCVVGNNEFEDVLELAKINPFTAELFDNNNIKIQNKNIIVEIVNFNNNFFDRIIHDPPTGNDFTELYNISFYEELYRVLKQDGKLYHYVPRPGINSNKNVLFEKVIKRLNTVGFKNVEYLEETSGIIASK